MKVIISPARRMKKTDSSEGSMPDFMPETSKLHKLLKSYSTVELESLLETNEQLALRAFEDYQDFSTEKCGSPALFSYDGLVYRNIDPESLSKQALSYADSCLRIISAFYGLLRPGDLIQPYRLEMLSGLKLDEGNLYDFWGDKIYSSLFGSNDHVINLASDEYAKCIRPWLMPYNGFTDIVFLTLNRGKWRVPTTPAKMARGRMVRFILENRLEKPETLKEFEWEGFSYRKSMSGINSYVFCREMQVHTIQ